MVTPTYPGVYIQEVPSGVHTITGVATSIAAFFGRATKELMNKAIRILSLSDYVRQFGEPHLCYVIGAFASLVVRLMVPWINLVKMLGSFLSLHFETSHPLRFAYLAEGRQVVSVDLVL